MDVLRDHAANGEVPLVAIAGICGPTTQAIAEAGLARDLGYDAGLVSLAALRDASNEALLEHCRRIAEVIPLFGFYLQPAVGGRILDHGFWRAFLEIDAVVAIKVAPFDRYRTLEVARAVAESGREDVALFRDTSACAARLASRARAARMMRRHPTPRGSTSTGWSRPRSPPRASTSMPCAA